MAGIFYPVPKWEAFCKESRPLAEISKSLNSKAHAAVVRDGGKKRFIGKIPNFLWTFVRGGFRTVEQKKLLFAKLQAKHEDLHRQYLAKLQALADSGTVAEQLENLVEVTAAKLKELKAQLKLEKETKAKLEVAARKLKRLWESAKSKADVCGEALGSLSVYDLAELDTREIKDKVGLFVKDDLKRLTRDDIIEILQALVTRGFKFTDQFINRGMSIETGKVSGRDEEWFREHLAGHLDIDMSLDAEDRLAEDAVSNMVDIEIDEDDDEDDEDIQPPNKRQRTEGEFVVKSD